MPPTPVSSDLIMAVGVRHASQVESRKQGVRCERRGGRDLRSVAVSLAWPGLNAVYERTCIIQYSSDDWSRDFVVGLIQIFTL